MSEQFWTPSRVLHLSSVAQVDYVVAAANACAGIPTSRLQEIARGERPESVEETAYVHHARRERNELRASHTVLVVALGKMAREHAQGCVACWTRTQIAQDALA